MADSNSTTLDDHRGFVLEPGRVDVEWSYKYGAPFSEAENDLVRAAAKLLGYERTGDYLHDAALGAAKKVVEDEFKVEVDA